MEQDKRDPFDHNIHDVTHRDMLAAIRAGQTDKVVDNLARRHPAIAVVLIVQAAHDRDLDVGQINTLANLLMDDFTELRDSKGLRATERVSVE